MLLTLEKGAQTIRFRSLESKFPCTEFKKKPPLCIPASQRWLRGFGTERARLGAFRGFGTFYYGNSFKNQNPHMKSTLLIF